MGGTSAWLADHVASLLPKTVTGVLPQVTAGACVSPSSFTESRHHHNQFSQDCVSTRGCRLSCHGKVICGAWVKRFCS
jgi:hypothetical protein